MGAEAGPTLGDFFFTLEPRGPQLDQEGCCPLGFPEKVRLVGCHVCRPLEQRFPTFLKPETSFVEELLHRLSG